MSKNWTPFAKMKKAAYNSRRLHLEAIRIGMPIPSPSLSRGRRKTTRIKRFVSNCDYRSFDWRRYPDGERNVIENGTSL